MLVPNNGLQNLKQQQKGNKITDNILAELYSAIANSEIKLVKSILQNTPSLLDVETPIGSWLHVAARGGNLEIVKYLIELGLDINNSSMDKMSGNMPIKDAAAKGHIEIAKYLLENGAKLDISEPEKNPLYSAIRIGRLDIAKLLVENGIDATVDYGTKNAISFAEEYGRVEMVEYLKGLIKNG